MSRGRKPLDPEERKARQRARCRAYWAEHKKEIARKRKEKYDPEVAKKNRAKWLEANRDRWNAYLREWRRKEKEEVDNVE